MIRKRIEIFAGEIWVVPLTWIEAVKVRIILWSIVEVVKGISLFNSKVLK